MPKLPHSPQPVPPPTYGRLGLLVLAVLIEGEAHGYDIMKSIENLSGGLWRPAPGSLYPLLVSLENEGLIECRVVGRPGTRRKRVCRLTSEGLKYFIDTAEKVLRNFLPIIAAVLNSYCKAVKRSSSLSKDERNELINSIINLFSQLYKAVNTCK